MAPWKNDHNNQTNGKPREARTAEQQQALALAKKKPNGERKGMQKRRRQRRGNEQRKESERRNIVRNEVMKNESVDIGDVCENVTITREIESMPVMT